MGDVMKIDESTYKRMPIDLQNLFVATPLDSPARRLDAQAGVLSITGKRSMKSQEADVLGTQWLSKNHKSQEYTDSGGASRFFFNVESQLDESDPILYCAKTSKKERNAGLGDHQQISQGCYGKFAGDGRGRQTEHQPTQNPHPTVKPLVLCQWLATLLLPPDSYTPRRLLVPFSGVSSEMIGALQSGWDRVLGIEQELEYIRIAKARITYYIPKKGQ